MDIYIIGEIVILVIKIKETLHVMGIHLFI